MNELRTAILAYADRIAVFQSGSDGHCHYGQGPDNPENQAAPPELADLAPSIGRLVRGGYSAAVARRGNDEARAAMYREDIPRMRYQFKDCGVSADELFSIGYNANRPTDADIRARNYGM